MKWHINGEENNENEKHENNNKGTNNENGIEIIIMDIIIII